MKTLCQLALGPQVVGFTTLTALACWAALTPPSANGRTNIHGIPQECSATVFSLEVPSFDEPAVPVANMEREFPELEVDSQELGGTYMSHRWAWHAYVQAHHGDTCVVHLEDGFVLHDGKRGVKYELDLRMNTPRDFIWHPDCRYLAFWAPTSCDEPRKRAAVLDVTKQVPGAKPDYTILYDPEPDHEPLSMEWAPDGKALLIMELVFEDNAAYTVLRRVALRSEGDPGKELVRVQGRIDFFSSPTTRYEYGAGSTDEPFSVVFGAVDGLYTVPGDGALSPHRLAKVPAEGLETAEWSPTGEQFAVYVNPATSDKGEGLQGLYLVDVNRPDDERLVRLYENLDVHTLWFSAKGTYVLWATSPLPGRPSSTDSEIHVVSTKDPSQVTRIKQVDPQGTPLAITGVCMNKEETRVAYTAANRVFVYDLESGKRAQIAHYPLNDPEMIRFAADPRWVKDRVVVSVYEDVSKYKTTVCRPPTFDLRKEFEALREKAAARARSKDGEQDPK
ncbi:MAG: hypothetical protein KDD82_01870 [Planctomycetes bacterium]|nr:hypothetical protein [Planctomycetota bacterium]